MPYSLLDDNFCLWLLSYNLFPEEIFVVVVSHIQVVYVTKLHSSQCTYKLINDSNIEIC